MSVPASDSVDAEGIASSGGVFSACHIISHSILSLGTGVWGMLMGMLPFLQGLVQANSIPATLRHVVRWPPLRHCLAQCFFLNFLIFGGFTRVYERWLPQLVHYLLGVPLLHDAIYTWVVRLVWTVPAYVVCEVVNITWYKQLVQHTIHTQAHTKTTSGSEGTSLTQIVQDNAAQLMCRFVYLAFLVGALCLQLIPILGLPMSGLFTAILYSCDAFDYRWALEGVRVSRFSLMEKHWLYFVGYGSSLAVLGCLLGYWDAFVLRATVYPVFLLNSFDAQYEGLPSTPLPVFQFAFTVVKWGVQSMEDMAARHVGSGK